MVRQNFEELHSFSIFNKICWYIFMKMNSIIHKINEKVEDIIR